MQTTATSVTTPTTTNLPWYRDHGVQMGALGVLIFSFTLPATHVALPAFGSVLVGLGRAIVAGVLAAMVLLWRREPLPPRRMWLSLGLVAFGVVVGFPLFSALALAGTPVAHGAVINGLLPLATAIGGVVRGHERPPLLFWLSGIVGGAAVILFAVIQGAGALHAGDWWMLAAVATGAVGYTEGGRLAREIGGWRVICWALIFAFPVLIGPVVAVLVQRGIPTDPLGWAGFGYVAVFSMFLGFFAWYRGLAIGGIARVGQIQLVQPLLTILWAVLLLGEHLVPLTAIIALVVVGCVVVGQRARRITVVPAAK
jgi:drug/metabolite transporter (DMT)-like permease